MNADKSYVMLSAVVFGFIGAMQLLRAVAGWPLLVNGFSVPVAASFVVGPLFLLLAGWGVAQLRRGP